MRWRSLPPAAAREQASALSPAAHGSTRSPAARPLRSPPPRWRGREAHHEGAIPAAGRERQGSWPEARALGYPRPRADRGGGPRRHDVARTDRRWLLAVAALLAAWLGVFVGAGAIYRATGPHPRVGAFLRRVPHHAHRLLHLRGRRGSR